MPVTMSNSYFFVQPGSKAFQVATNFTNYLELGTQSSEPDYYLEARINEDEFLIAAVLWEPNTGSLLRIVDNFPEGPAWSRQMLPNGWRIVDQTGKLMLGLEVEGQICHIRGKLTAKDGSIVAEDSNNDFLIHHGPAVIGRSGGAIGILI